MTIDFLGVSLTKLEYESVRRYFDRNYLPEPNTGCHLWLGSLFWDGYGQFNFSAGGVWHKARANRASLCLRDGAVPADQSALHTCDVTSCVNEAHLFWGTQFDNMADMTAKGHRARYGLKGEAHPGAKLSARDVLAIRADKRLGREIAKDHHVNRSVIYNIKHRKTWDHL